MPGTTRTKSKRGGVTISEEGAGDAQPMSVSGPQKATQTAEATTQFDPTNRANKGKMSGTTRSKSRRGTTTTEEEGEAEKVTDVQAMSVSGPQTATQTAATQFDLATNRQLTEALQLETSAPGPREQSHYQRIFLRVLRDLTAKAAAQTSRVSKPAIRDTQRTTIVTSRAEVSIMLPCSVAEMPPQTPLEILRELMQADCGPDVRTEAACLAACLMMAHLRKPPAAKEVEGSPSPQVVYRNKILHAFLVYCHCFLHADDIAQALADQAKQLPWLLTGITKTLVPSLIRAVRRIKMYAVDETNPADNLGARREKTLRFYAQIPTVVRYLWAQSPSSNELLADDFVTMHACRDTMFQEAQPAITATIALFADLLSDSANLGRSNSPYSCTVKVGDFGPLTSKQPITDTAAMFYLAVWSGDDNGHHAPGATPVTPATYADADGVQQQRQQQRMTAREVFVAEITRDRGSVKAVLDARRADMELLFDCTLALLLPPLRAIELARDGDQSDQSDQFDRPTASKQRQSDRPTVPPKPRIIAPDAVTGPDWLAAVSMLAAFRTVLLENVRRQMDIIAATVGSIMDPQHQAGTPAGAAGTATGESSERVVANVVLHNSVVEGLAPLFAHFLAMTIALGCYHEHQQTLRYFSFGSEVSFSSIGRYGGSSSVLMATLHWTTFQCTSVWLSVLRDIAVGDAVMARRVQANILQFLAKVLTQENVLKHLASLHDPLPANVQASPEASALALARNNDSHTLARAKRTLRVLLRAIAASLTWETTPQESFVQQGVQYLADASAMIPVPLIQAKGAMQRSTQEAFGLGDLEEDSEGRAQMNSLALWEDMLLQLLYSLATAADLSADVIHVAMLRLYQQAGDGGGGGSVLRNIYSAIGLLSVLQSQPLVVREAMVAAHLWSLQERERAMLGLVSQVSAENPGYRSFQAYGTRTIGDVARTAVNIRPLKGVPAGAEDDGDGDAGTGEEADVDAQPVVLGVEEERLEDPRRVRRGTEEGRGEAPPAPQIVYPTRSDAVLSDMLAVAISLARAKTIDGTQVSSVIADAMSAMLLESKQFHPKTLTRESTTGLVMQNVLAIEAALQLIQKESEAAAATTTAAAAAEAQPMQTQLPTASEPLSAEERRLIDDKLTKAVLQGVQSAAEVLFSERQESTELTTQTLAGVPPPEEPDRPARVHVYQQLVVFVHQIPEVLTLDPSQGVCKAYEVPRSGQIPDLLVVCRLGTPDLPRGLTPVQQQDFAQKTQIRATQALITAIDSALQALYGPEASAVATLTDPAIQIRVIPYVCPSLLGTRLVKFLSQVPQTQRLQKWYSDKDDRTYFSVPVAPLDRFSLDLTDLTPPLFFPPLVSASDAAAVIACFSASSGHGWCARIAATAVHDRLMAEASAAAAAAAAAGSLLEMEQGVQPMEVAGQEPTRSAQPVRLRDEDLFAVALCTIWVYATRGLKREDELLLRVMDQENVDTVDQLVKNTQVLVFCDLPVFWITQTISRIREHPAQKPIVVLICFTTKRGFMEAVVTNRCVRMDVQGNALKRFQTTKMGAVCVHPRALVGLLGGPEE